jgi:uncharacterized protein (DUF2252 family)
MATVEDSRLTLSERHARGRAARAEVPRSSHADWAPPSDRPDPVELLEEQAATRVPELVPIRNGRMAVSPFTFYRGAAYVMASDLAPTPRTGLLVQACGDAHLSNFGGFAAPDRHLVFDVNDFDETLPGPWEWDVKRLAVSLEIAGRDRECRRKQRERVVRSAVGVYRVAMGDFAAMGNLDVFYVRMDRERVVALAHQAGRGDVVEELERNTAKARKKDRLRALRKLTVVEDGRRRFASDPPLLVPVRELAPAGEPDELMGAIGELYGRYRDTLREELRGLLERYEFVDLARKVVGVGSVGTQAWVVLLIGRDDGDPLFLQVKEAQPSVLERFVAPSAFDNHGQRVVEGQRMTQAASDILLGWIRNDAAPDGGVGDFYVRQLWDWKQSAEIEDMNADALEIYGGLCGWALARAHARSGDSVAISGYLGKSDRFDRALASFAAAYADQNERDHRAFLDAIEAGKVPAERGI